MCNASGGGGGVSIAHLNKSKIITDTPFLLFYNIGNMYKCAFTQRNTFFYKIINVLHLYEYSASLCCLRWCAPRYNECNKSASLDFNFWLNTSKNKKNDACYVRKKNCICNIASVLLLLLSFLRILYDACNFFFFAAMLWIYSCVSFIHAFLVLNWWFAQSVSIFYFQWTHILNLML